MKSRFVWAVALFVAVGVGWFWIVETTAQEQSTSISTGSKSLQPPGPPAKSEKDPDENLRYEFMQHAFGVDDVEQEIYIKLDSFTGKTWRFHASAKRWDPIPEPTDSQHPVEASEYGRYELHTHDYFDTSGEEQELILRVDLVSGFAWTYRGPKGEWKDVGQD